MASAIFEFPIFDARRGEREGMRCAEGALKRVRCISAASPVARSHPTSPVLSAPEGRRGEASTLL
jgi:hypothetical protein